MKTASKVIVLVLVLLIASAAFVFHKIGTPVKSQLNVMNQNGTIVALVIYHPGTTGFQRKVMKAFSEGLASVGYRVEMTTASPEAPGDVSSYDLLVLGSPTYGANSSKPLEDYVMSLGDLRELSVIAIATGAGNADASSHIEGMVHDANGTVVTKLGYVASPWGPKKEILDDARSRAQSIWEDRALT